MKLLLIQQGSLPNRKNQLFTSECLQHFSPVKGWTDPLPRKKKPPVRKPRPSLPSPRCISSLSTLLSKAAIILSPWPPVQPLGHSHLSRSQNQCWAVFPHWFERRLPSASRADQPRALHPPVPRQFPFLSQICTVHPSIHGLNEAVSMNKVWDQGLRDLEVVPALLLVYFRYVDLKSGSGCSVLL